MMNSNLVEKFEKMGARIKIRKTPVSFTWRGDRIPGVPRLNVVTDKRGEFFDFAIPEDNDRDIICMDVQKKDRHLLLMVRGEESAPGKKDAIHDKMLCGHDERHWFVAGVPSDTSHSVATAKESLKPREVRAEQARKGGKRSKRNKRKNDVYIRQGEWFFIPDNIKPDEQFIIKNEPLSRGRGSKPHMMEFVYRHGGDTVYVSGKYPDGISQESFNKLSHKEKNDAWRVMVRNAAVYCKGRIAHADHATVTLNGWHRVMMNTEGTVPGRTVAFLD